MLSIDIDQTQANFPELIEKTIRNGEITITKDGQPAAKLVPFTKKNASWGPLKV